MFRVKVNLWINKAVSDAVSEDMDSGRRGDWVEEQKHVDVRLTREDMYKTFEEKFPASCGSEVKNIA